MYWLDNKEFCETYDEKTIANVPGITLDEDTLDNIKYAHSAERLAYRGILYATPAELDWNRFQLKKLNRRI